MQFNMPTLAFEIIRKRKRKRRRAREECRALAESAADDDDDDGVSSVSSSFVPDRFMELFTQQ